MQRICYDVIVACFAIVTCFYVSTKIKEITRNLIEILNVNRRLGKNIQ